jgi:hypothetical protein
MAFPGSIYAPPGVYTQTRFEDPTQGLANTLRLPMIIGTGSEILVQSGLEMVRGSSSTVDQRIVQEDEAGRAVTAISAAGAVTLGAFDGTFDRIQTKHFPIVSGDGTGTNATDAASVAVTINGTPVMVLAIDGVKGVLTLSSKPLATDVVKVTYFFNRTDTLITDTLSDQISPDAPQIYGAVGQNFTITEDENDELIFTVDSETTITATIAPSPAGGWTAAQVAAFVNSAASATSLVASSALDNYGNTVLHLVAERDIKMGAGSANTTLGFTNGADTGRNKVFYTFQRPIVDGSNGGVTTTDPADVTVKVDGAQVIPTAVDGQSGAVSLPFAPEIGAVVTCQYYFNSWQDTFDYLAHRNVIDVTQCGVTPDRNDYIEGADFILQDDKILWGTAVTVEAGEHTTGSVYLDDTQVSGTLVDVRQYLAACSAVVNTSVNPAVENRQDFQLPLQPTTGNGRNSPLGATTYNEVANGRLDLPTDRPDLVWAYWGFSLNDALERGRVAVEYVDSATSTITLREPVPTGATVYATFYYNTLVDMAYSVACVSADAAGVGTYKVSNSSAAPLYTPQFTGKGAAMSTVVVQFPSGSEMLPDCRFESPLGSATGFVGPVEEDVTVTFAAQDATPAKYTVPGSGPYYLISGASDNFDVEFDSTSLSGGFIDLSNPMTSGCGFPAQLVSNEVSYDADAGYTTYAIDTTNRALDFSVDGILIQASANSSATGTLANYVEAINDAAWGDWDTVGGVGAVDTEIQLVATASDIDDYYVGWSVQVITSVTVGIIGDVRTITAYDAATQIATVDAAWNGAVVVPGAATYRVFNADVIPTMVGTTRFLQPVVVALNEFDQLSFSYNGDTTGTAISTITLVPGTYTTVALLVDQINTQLDTVYPEGGAGTLATTARVTCAADSNGRLVFSMYCQAGDNTGGGYLEVVSNGSPVRDFATLAGFDHAAAGADQMKIVHGPIARRYTSTGAVTGALQYDRMILRNRIVPGRGSLDGQWSLDQCELQFLGGTGSTEVGLSATEKGYAGLRGTVMAPTLVSEVGLSGGQDAAGEPIVTFFQSGGTTPQNNIFAFTFDGTPVSLEFTDAAGVAIAIGASADVPLGPSTDVNSVLGQIAAAMTAQGLSTTGTILQEGAGIRLRGVLQSAPASIVVGSESANSVLGFSDGAEVYRTVLTPAVLASALMSHSQATAVDAMLDWSGAGAATYFTAMALAKVEEDGAGADYLYLQSIGAAGTSSSITVMDAPSASVTLPVTGLGVEAGSGNVGEDAIDGFFVTSSSVTGSGTANTSLLNSGTGQDGQVGQTYRDTVTGLVFTILPREGGASYPTGGTATLTFSVRTTVTSDGNSPVNTIPGLQLYVSNTSGVGVGDTAIVQTFEQGGAQPAVGDVYYVSYDYRKQDFSPQLFTKMSSIEAAYGSKSPNHPVTLASYLALTNGAVLIGIKQVQKDTDSDADGVNDAASEDAYIAAIDALEGGLPGGIYLDVLVPLKGDSLTLYNHILKHCDIQSSIRYRAERTCIGGFSAGTEPREAGADAQALDGTRMRLVYPDMATLTLSRADGTSDSYLVDGTYLASAVTGSTVSPTIDVATPWTGMRLFGFDQLGRILDAVQQNQVAVKGITVLEDKPPVIRIRHGLTTDMKNVLTKTPTVITIADEVQRQARATLDRFIGTKFLPGVTSTIEIQLATALKQMMEANIIAAYTGVSANVDEEDPTVANVEAYYQPIFPLLYIVVTFNLRSSL